MRRASIPLLLLAALLGGSAPRASAQASAAQSTTIHVSVANGLTVLIDQDLDFGAVIAGSGSTRVDLSSANVGRLHIVGGQNRAVTITLAPPAELLNGTSTIPYDWEAAYNEYVNAPSDSRTVVFGPLTATFRLRDATVWKNYGQAFLWVYGTVTVGTVVPGVYTGTFTVSAAY